MKNRKLVVGLLVMLAVVMSTLTFAYWASGISGDDDVASQTITVGTGEAVTTTVVLSKDSQTSGVLVPAGRADNSVEGTAVESVVIQYTVTLDEDQDNNTFDGDEATLSVAYSNLLVDGVADTYDLVNISLSYTATIAVDGTQTVTITVTLDEPANQTEYDAVAGLDITFDLTFTASFA